MKILVTGGAGFIGSHFIRYILRNYPHNTIINLDLLTYAGNLESLRDIAQNPNYQFVHGDICNSELVERILSEGESVVDTIINFAAESHVDRSIVEPERFVRTNVLGTQNLLEAARKHKVKKFIQISTDEVYGSLGENGYFTEKTPLAPNSPYSASKAGADLLVRSYYHTYGIPVNITRCSNNYGPFQFPEKLIPLMVINAIQDKKLPVYGDGTNIRDWLHVEDHCSAIDLVCRKGKPGEVYNIGGNNEWTNIELVKKILSLLGKSEDLLYFAVDRPGHDFRYAIDATKIRKELGWKPSYSFETGLKQTVNWYVQNRDWWIRIQNQNGIGSEDRGE